jgi:fibronectin-binding autotransporter adhesin
VVSGTTGVDLTTTGGGLVSQTAAGTVSTGMLTGNPSGTVDLSGATNAVSDLGALTLGGDFALNNGTNALQVTAPINAAGHTLTLNAGAITQTAAAAIAAGTLTGGSSGAVDLSTATNAISSFGAFAAGGDVTLNNGSTALQFAGAFTGGGTLTLTAGPITQSAGAAITAGTLTGTSSGAVDLSTATNAIGNLGAFAPGGNFKLNNGSSALQFTGPFAGSGETLTLNAGPVSQTAAATIVAGTLTGASSGAVDLSTATNSIGNLGAFTTGGNFALNNGTNALRITAPISAAGATLTLTAGTITQTAAAVITAGALTGTSSGAVELSAAANAIDSVGSFTAVGDFSLSTEISAQPNPVRLGTVSGGSVAVTAHDITVAGLMTASDLGGTLALTADTITFFPGLGQLAAPNGTVRLGPVTNGIAFDIAFEPASGGLVQLANNVALQITTPTLVIGQGSGAAVAGSIAFNQPFSWPNALNLQTTGAVTQQSPIAAGVLSGLAGSVNLTGAAGNAVATLGLFRATAGDFDLTQSAPLMVAGPLSADNINLTAAGPTGGIAISGSVTAAGGNLVLAAGDQGISLQSPLTVATLDLSATGGGVTEAAGGGIDATTLQSSAGVTGSVALTTGTNNIANLSQFTVAGGDLALSDGSTALQIIGPVGAAGHTLSLAVGPVTQTASGAITAGTFTGSSSGAVDLGTATNAISALGAFTPGGNFTLNNGANALQFTGAFAGGGDTLTLTVGSITQTALGAITAGTLTGSSSGSVDLRAAGNAIATLGAFAANGIFDVLQSSPLSVTGPVNASNIILNVPGPTGGLVFSGPVTATSGLFLIAGDQGIALDAGAALTAVSAKLGAGAGGVNEAAGASLTVENLQVSGPPIGGTVDLRQGTNAVSTLGPFQVAGGDFNLVQSRPLSVVGQVSANNINLVASGVTGGINVSAPMTAANSLALTAGDAGVTLNGAIATPDLHIDASGTITQTGGSLAVGTLSGSARHLAEFAANTNVATLGAFTVTGSDFVLNDTGPLTIAGPLSAQYIAITALGQVTLIGTIATMGVPVAQQSGAQPATPGSFIDVLSGAAGSGRFVTTGLAAFVPLGAPTATVRIDVPGNGGLMFFDPPFAPQVFLVLDTGVGGRSLGTLDVGGLLVLGTGGSATLFGTVDGLGGFGAAAVSQISPHVDAAYTFNGCAIATATCLTMQSLLQAETAAYRAVASPLLLPLALLAVPQLPAPLGWLSSDDVVPPNISDVDY